MHLTEDDIREFAELWRQENGESFSAGDAHHRASQLMELYALLLMPDSKSRAGSADAPDTIHAK